MIKNLMGRNFIGISGVPKDAELLTGVSVGEVVVLRGVKFVVSIDNPQGEGEVVLVTKNPDTVDNIQTRFGEMWEHIFTLAPASNELAKIRKSTTKCRAALRLLKKNGYDPAKLSLTEVADFYEEYESCQDIEHALTWVPVKAQMAVAS